MSAGLCMLSMLALCFNNLISACFQFSTIVTLIICILYHNLLVLQRLKTAPTDAQFFVPLITLSTSTATMVLLLIQTMFRGRAGTVSVTSISNDGSNNKSSSFSALKLQKADDEHEYTDEETDTQTLLGDELVQKQASRANKRAVGGTGGSSASFASMLLPSVLKRDDKAQSFIEQSEKNFRLHTLMREIDDREQNNNSTTSMSSSMTSPALGISPSLVSLVSSSPSASFLYMKQHKQPLLDTNSSFEQYEMQQMHNNDSNNNGDAGSSCSKKQQG